MSTEKTRREGESRSRYLVALSYPEYRTLWSANIFAGAAAWGLIVARGWLVYDMSESSVWVGLVTFAAMIPRVIVTPFTGYLSDRLDRKSLLAATFALNGLHNLLLAFLVLTGTVQIWHLVALSLVNGSARAAQMPTAQALVPNLVPRSLLLNAIALNQAAIYGSRLLGPAAIAPLMSTTSAEATFFLCSGFYAVGLLQVLRIRTVSTGVVDRSRGLARNLAAGVVYMYRTPTLRAIVMLAVFHCGLTMSYESLLPVLSRQRLDAEGAGFSYLMMAVGAGAVLSIVIVAGIRSEATRGRWFLNFGVLSGVAPAILAISTNMPMALVGAAAIGAAQAGFMTLTHTMIQAIVPDSVRGRAAAAYSIHIGGTMATVNLINGGLADVVGAPVLLLAAGAAFVAVMFASWRGIVLRGIYTSGLRTEAHGAAE